jgi:hypothetical protein
MLSRYGPAHYEAHRAFLRGYDLVYPVLYGVPLSIILAYFFPVLFPGGGRRWRWLVLLPLAAVAFDYAENVTVLSALDYYEATRQLSLGQFQAARLFTAAKLLLLLASALVLLVFGARALVRLRRAGQ